MTRRGRTGSSSSRSACRAPTPTPPLMCCRTQVNQLLCTGSVFGCRRQPVLPEDRAAVLGCLVLAATRLYLAFGFVALSGAWIMQMSSHGFWGVAAIVGLYIVGGGLIAVGCLGYRQLPYPEPE